ncbi:MAG TPA: diacylglycerol kinase family protein [Pyrinomonadaceae bacterium]|jgi:diacylglycerol kinase (ATP)
MADESLTLTGRIRSFKFAFNGIRIMFCSQQNAWIHALATAVVVVWGINFELTKSEWCWIVLAAVSVWTTEALNTAFEFLTDVASPEFHPLAAQAKDVAAGAVLITASGAIVIGLLIFGPYLSALSGNLF